jgi:molecular chaperone DnaK
MPQIEVTFDIDANGILHVSAKDLGTGKDQKIRIEASSGLNDGDIDKMVKEAESHAEEDRKRKEEIAEINRADALSYEAEKLLREHGDKASEEDKTQINEAIENLKKAIAARELIGLKSAMDRLNTTVHKLSAKLYEHVGGNAGPSAQSGPSSQAGPAPGGPAQEDVVDAEFEVKDENK